MVVAKGVELGVGTWDKDRPHMQFPVYKELVTKAMRQREARS
jgi:hypothetical protein